MGPVQLRCYLQESDKNYFRMSCQLLVKPRRRIWPSIPDRASSSVDDLRCKPELLSDAECFNTFECRAPYSYVRFLRLLISKRRRPCRLAIADGTNEFASLLRIGTCKYKPRSDTVDSHFIAQLHPSQVCFKCFDPRATVPPGLKNKHHRLFGSLQSKANGRPQKQKADVAVRCSTFKSVEALGIRKEMKFLYRPTCTLSAHSVGSTELKTPMMMMTTTFKRSCALGSSLSLAADFYKRCCGN